MRRCLELLVIVHLLLFLPSLAKTRWGSLHIVPDADMLNSGELLVGFDGFVAENYRDETLFNFAIPLRFGINEWVNLDVAYGYGGGMTLGIKARIFGETSKAMPTLTIGAYNLFSHREANLFYVDSSDAIDMTGEVFLALAKSIETIKTRIHVGFQSIPVSETDKANIFVALEKYFGLGLYVSLEFYRRKEEFHLSLFGNWRILKNRLEISLGAVDMKNILFDDNDKFSVSLSPSTIDAWVKPGVWVGLKFHGRFGLGKNRGFMTIEDRLRKQDDLIVKLSETVDSLTNYRITDKVILGNLKESVDIFMDSVNNDPKKIKNILFSKLLTLKSLYEINPYDPDQVRLLLNELLSYRGKAIPSLHHFLLDPKTDRYVRIYSALLLGDMGSNASTDILLEVLAQTPDPDIKIEILIALGKLKETRAMYMIELLAGSLSESVAITAQEVLLRLSKETGVNISSDLRFKINDQKEREKRQLDSIAIADTVLIRNNNILVEFDSANTDTNIISDEALFDTSVSEKIDSSVESDSGEDVLQNSDIKEDVSKKEPDVKTDDSTLEENSGNDKETGTRSKKDVSDRKDRKKRREKTKENKDW